MCAYRLLRRLYARGGKCLSSDREIQMGRKSSLNQGATKRGNQIKKLPAKPVRKLKFLKRLRSAYSKKASLLTGFPSPSSVQPTLNKNAKKGTIHLNGWSVSNKSSASIPQQSNGTTEVCKTIKGKKGRPRKVKSKLNEEQIRQPIIYDNQEQERLEECIQRVLELRKISQIWELYGKLGEVIEYVWECFEFGTLRLRARPSWDYIIHKLTARLK